MHRADSWTKGQKHQGKTSSQVWSMTALKQCFHEGKSSEKCLSFTHWRLWRESFSISLWDSALVGWAEKSQQFNCLFVCSSQKPGHCPVSMNICGWRSRRSSLRWAPAAILCWLKADVFYSAGVILLSFLVSIKLLWKSSTVVAEGIQEKEQLLLPWEEQTLQGTLKCHVLPCCSSPFTEWLGLQPWDDSFLTWKMMKL